MSHPRSEIKSTSVAAIVLGIFCIFTYTITRWLTKTFGDISFEQLLWNITNPAIGSDINLIKSLGDKILKAILLSLAWIVIVLKFEDYCRILLTKLKKPKVFLIILIDNLKPKYNSPHYSLLFLIISLFAFIAVSIKINNNFNIIDFIQNGLSTNQSLFIEENYYVPSKEEIVFQEKKNIVLVLSESFETSFFEPNTSKQPLSSTLFPLLKNGVSNSNMVQGYGNNWTIAALTGWHFGLPLKLPPLLKNSYHSYRGFLPNAKSIFDIFRENGYKTVLLLGSESYFSNQQALFRGHGNFEIYDLSYWKQKGWNLEENQGTGWGYSDQFLFERAKEKYTELLDKKEPFILLIETIDTHAPNGYCPKTSVIYGDIRDAMAEADRLLSNFYHYITKNQTKQTVLGIIGDHYFMGKPNYLIEDKRRIFNAFWGDLPEVPEYKLQQAFTCMDIAPTLLHVAGAKWSNNQFGLGISLFSEDKTLSERIGIETLSKELEQRSSKYNTFY